MKIAIKSLLALSLSLPLSCFAFNFKHGTVDVQFGGFTASQGKAQNINIQSLIGNIYTVSNNSQWNGLFGIGYFIDGLDKDLYHLSYGINGYYLGKTSVSGVIYQEHLFANLMYGYTIQNSPIYIAAKALVKNNSEKYNFILDAGIGPNLMKTSHYMETPLNTFTLPDNGFAAHSNVAFSAMAGVGLRLNNVFGKAPLECGYHFFYLGQGQLAINNNQILNTIKTGNNYANAISCGIAV